MSDMKEEALKLADFIEKHMVEFGLILGEVSRDHIVGTIRKLVDELNTAPRELSDEEILNIADGYWLEENYQIIEFVKEILKKANEK